jgi:ATP adenylyltransferase
MKNLYAPWRSDYTTSTARTKNENAPSDACVFCAHRDTVQDDEKNFILKRYKHVLVMFNKYPYNAGHLLVVPFEHVSSPELLNTEALVELMEITSKCVVILRHETGAEGFNIGLNLGKAAGAGIPSHLHMHVLPRFTGDTNFLPTLGETRVISFDLPAMYNHLKAAFNK